MRVAAPPTEQPLRHALPSILTAILLACLAGSAAIARPAIIDMHMHARTSPIDPDHLITICIPPSAMPRWDNSRSLDEGMAVEEENCEQPIVSGASIEAIRRDTIAIMERRNIIAMVGGEPDSTAAWIAEAPERVIAGLDLRITERRSSRFPRRSPDEVRALYAAHRFAVLGEVMTQYEGIAPNDPLLEPYWALAEELDIPMGIHMGPGGGGDPYAGSPGFRARMADPLQLEEVLVRHPRLRLYIMHAGYPFADHLIALLETYPQVYVDTAAIITSEPRPAFYAYLRRIVEAGFGDRIMFGSDHVIAPGVIEPAIAAIEEAPFLSDAQRRDILYNNAARFLRLTEEQIARHQAM